MAPGFARSDPQERLRLILKSTIALAALVAAIVVSGASAQTGTPLCQHHYTVSEFRSDATRVYHQPARIKPHQLYRLLHLRVCAITTRARHAMNRIQLRQRHARIMRRARARRLACSNTNPKACILIAARRFGVSYTWLVACANSEGGTGPSDYDKMNYQGSGAGGNFQFMASTFYAYIRKTGWKGKAIWLNSEQQALTAAYMFSIGQSGQWSGGGC